MHLIRREEPEGVWGVIDKCLVLGRLQINTEEVG